MGFFFKFYQLIFFSGEKEGFNISDPNTASTKQVSPTLQANLGIVWVMPWQTTVTVVASTQVTSPTRMACLRRIDDTATVRGAGSARFIGKSSVIVPHGVSIKERYSVGYVPVPYSVRDVTLVTDHDA